MRQAEPEPTIPQTKNFEVRIAFGGLHSVFIVFCSLSSVSPSRVDFAPKVKTIKRFELVRIVST
jgi:hypothetical protein